MARVQRWCLCGAFFPRDKGAGEVCLSEGVLHFTGVVKVKVSNHTFDSDIAVGEGGRGAGFLRGRMGGSVSGKGELVGKVFYMWRKKLVFLRAIRREDSLYANPNRDLVI